MFLQRGAAVCGRALAGKGLRRVTARSQSSWGRCAPSTVQGSPYRLLGAAAGAAGFSLAILKGQSSLQLPSSCSTQPKYPGTDIPINSDGVSFPIQAICEVGEAGKSCDGCTTSSGVTGFVKFTQIDAETVVIEYEVKGLKPGLHGFHIHEKADFSKGCASAGPHYNPFKKTHGGCSGASCSIERHVGDLGNIEAGADGVAVGKVTDKLIKLFGEYSVVGRSVMVHADEDDIGNGPLMGWPQTPPPPAPAQHTKTTGNAGARIGCGEIKGL